MFLLSFQGIEINRRRRKGKEISNNRSLLQAGIDSLHKVVGPRKAVVEGVGLSGKRHMAAVLGKKAEADRSDNLMVLDPILREVFAHSRLGRGPDHRMEAAGRKDKGLVVELCHMVAVEVRRSLIDSLAVEVDRPRSLHAKDWDSNDRDENDWSCRVGLGDFGIRS
jgi:hypothetical protein